MIPALAFKDRTADFASDPRNTTGVRAAFDLNLHEFRRIKKGEDFFYKISLITINDLKLIASTSNGIYFERGNFPGVELMLPLECREGYVEVDGYRSCLEPGSKAFFHGFGEKKQCTTGSGVAINFSTEKLNATCAALLGVDHKPRISVNVQTPSLEVRDIAFLHLFKSIFHQIDATGANAKLLEKLSVDDSIYRLCVGLLYPDLFLTDETYNGKRPYVRPEITKLCEFLAAHLTQPVTLTQMEQMSGLSARVLQRSFQKAFGLRPKQWLRNQRLHAARSAMLNPNEHTTITSMAYDFCFASPSEFARHYLAEFGERPSQTLARK